MTNVIDPIDEDRGIPSVNDREHVGHKKVLVLAFLLCFLAIVGGLVYFSFIGKSQDAEEARSSRDMQIADESARRSFDLPPPAPEMPTPAIPVQAAAPAPEFSMPQDEIDKSRFGLMLSSSAAANTGVDDESPAVARRVQGGEGALSGMLTGTPTPAEAARMLPDRNFLLTKGSFIECALQTRLDSTVPGMVACVTNRHIYSANGRVLLIDRGSKLTGEYRAGIKQGQARIYVLWTRVETPAGVVINLDSPGTDFLGGGGVPGHVDTHFWKRFGGAILLSMIEMGADVVRDRLDDGGDSYSIGSGDTDTSEMATEALRNTINIPPTLYVNQGERIGIYVARDLDFSTVYDLRISP